eukprot:209212-Alexandrium_andersonii.AAC.1
MYIWSLIGAIGRSRCGNCALPGYPLGCGLVCPLWPAGGRFSGVASAASAAGVVARVLPAGVGSCP